MICGFKIYEPWIRIVGEQMSLPLVCVGIYGTKESSHIKLKPAHGLVLLFTWPTGAGIPNSSEIRVCVLLGLYGGWVI